MESPVDKAPERRTFWFTVARAFAWLMFHTVYPISYEGRERFTREAPYIVLANHLSGWDPLAVAMPCKRYEIHFLGKRELLKGGVVTHVMKKLHIIAVNRRQMDMAAMRACMSALRGGYVLGIFPEGTRYHPGIMQEMETGVAVLAHRSKAPLLPVYIAGKIRPFRRTRVVIGEPLEMGDLYAREMSGETLDAILARIRGYFERQCELLPPAA